MKNNTLIYLISFFSGFLSLAIEIIWMRTISFVAMSAPQAFAYTLAVFLLGIAIGAALGKKLCSEAKIGAVSVGKIYMLAGIVDLCILGASIKLATNEYIIFMMGGFVLISAIIRGIVFPVVHHLGVDNSKKGKSSEKSGRQVSNVYFLNVFGSSLAPLTISFVLLEHFTTQQVYLMVVAITFLISALCLRSLFGRIVATLFMSSTLVTASQASEQLFHNLSVNSYTDNHAPEKILENKHGFISVYTNKDPEMKHDRLVFGNNAYDGRLNTDIYENTNGISRAYLLATMKKDLNNVLVVGLSSGAWTEILTSNPNIKKITVVEINPAYLKLIESEPTVANLLKDKRLEIIIDDGRKWIKRNQDKKFDLVMINTTFHWRAYSSNLLSQEFLGLLKNVLNKNGLAYYNSTLSADAYYTANKVFPYTYQHKYMVVVGNEPITINKEVVEDQICKLKNQMNGEQLFKTRFDCHIAALAATEDPLIPYKDINFHEFAAHEGELITDDNMLTEYKHGGNKTRKN